MNERVIERVSDVLTPAQAAAFLQVSEAAVRGLLRRGALPGRKMGRLWRLRRADLDAFLGETEYGRRAIDVVRN